MTRLQKTMFVIAALVVGISGLAGEAPVWFWFSTCGGPLMALEVQLDATAIFKGSFPTCQANRSSSYRQGQSSRLEFFFRADREIVWEGYRDEVEQTSSGQRLECQLWQAGADANRVTLGVVFLDEDRIHMNTLHVMKPGVETRTEIADGLVLLTYPVTTVDDSKDEILAGPPNK
jgi:hypothetical protein